VDDEGVVIEINVIMEMIVMGTMSEVVATAMNEQFGFLCVVNVRAAAK
jgi:hypothetical protein